MCFTETEAKDWLEEQFEFEFCPECGGDADDHRVIAVLGNPFALCLHLLPEDATDEE